jgi:propanol-preferring alcohol dehydrogenase
MDMNTPDKMHAMVLDAPGTNLKLLEVAVPRPKAGQVLLKVHACGICRTDLHILDGELKHPKLPLILGHQIVGSIVEIGASVSRFQVGERIGIPWLGYSDGTCPYCLRGQENLCNNPRFTGYTIDGGFAEYAVADQRYCFTLPEEYTDSKVAPLLCAGMIGYRTYRLAGKNLERLGIYGFGAAAHIITQVAIHQGLRVFAFTRPGDSRTQDFARSLGTAWAGDSTQLPPDKLDAALIFAPVGSLIVNALRATDKGGTVVSGGIHMSDIPSFPYRLLWGERQVRSVANLTRQDGEEFLAVASKVRIQTTINTFPLSEANKALESLRNGQIQGAAVLVME